MSFTASYWESELSTYDPVIAMVFKPTTYQNSHVCHRVSKPFMPLLDLIHAVHKHQSGVFAWLKVSLLL